MCHRRYGRSYGPGPRRRSACSGPPSGPLSAVLDDVVDAGGQGLHVGRINQATRPTRAEAAFIDVALIEWNQDHDGERTVPGDEDAGRGAAGPASARRLSQARVPRLRHSPELHEQLISRVPAVTGRDLSHWFAELDAGPAFLRAEERARWLADEYGLSDGYASAIALEYDLHREGLATPTQES